MCPASQINYTFTADVRYAAKNCCAIALPLAASRLALSVMPMAK
jgi:hypothetical protein